MTSEDQPPVEVTAGTGAEESGARIYTFIRSAFSAGSSPQSRITGRILDEPSLAEVLPIPTPSTGSERSASPATTGTAPETRADQEPPTPIEAARMRAAFRYIGDRADPPTDRAHRRRHRAAHGRHQHTQLRLPAARGPGRDPQVSGHSMRIVGDDSALLPVCHEPEGAFCRVRCPKGCESWNDEHPHKLMPIDFCNAIESIQNDGDGPMDSYCGGPLGEGIADGTPINVWWDTVLDIYLWNTEVPS